MSERVVIFLSILCTATILIAPNAMADGLLSSDIVNSPQDEQVVISNGLLKLSFAPDLGGRCVRFEFLDTNEELIDTANPHAGMFIDHWARFPWPSGLMHLPYEWERVGDGKTTVGIRLWVTVPEMGGGMGHTEETQSLAIPTDKRLVGLVIQKTIVLHADSDVVHVEMTIKNPQDESRSAALFVQHNFNMGGAPEDDMWLMPSPRGVVARVMPESPGQKALGPQLVEEPTAGWIAVTDRECGRGLVFAFDYNNLSSIYTSGKTAEWRMENIPLLPHGEFTTDYIIRPLRDLEEVDFASSNVVADVIVDQIGDSVRIFNDLTATDGELTNVDVDLTVTNWTTKEVLQSFHKRIDRLASVAKERQEFTFKPTNLAQGLVVKARVSGEGFEETYEYFYAGDEAEYERRYGYFSGTADVQGGIGKSYRLEPPRKIKTFAKPALDVLASNIAKDAEGPYRVLVVFGLYTEYLKIDDALASWKAPNGKTPTFTWANCPPNGVEDFPESYEELFSYDAVVLSNVNREALGDIRIEQLCDYAWHGGNVLVTGGFYTYGDGEFEGSRFLEMLPVVDVHPFDLKWAGKNQSWPLLKQTSHPIVAGLEMDESPRAYWCHFLTARPEADVVLTAGDRPMLVLGRYGKGYVAASMLTPMGSPGKGEEPWWQWDGWSTVVRGVFDWFGSAHNNPRS